MRESNIFFSDLDPAEGQPKFVLRGLDGVRALAVLLVLVYHYWPQYLPGGMIGVDIFFVISGYLITALLLREGAYRGKVDLPKFWVRRLRRLVPALVLLVLVVSSLSLLVGPDARVGLGRQVLGAATYTSNWLLIWAGNDYFNQTSPELFTNLWSLAVEEQFYLFWPIVLVLAFMFLSSWRQRRVVPAALGLLSLALAAGLSWAGAGTARLYYGTDTHLFGLMLGVLLAFALPWSMYPPADSRLYTHMGWGRGPLGLVRMVLGWVCLVLIFPLALILQEQNAALFMPWGLLASSLLGVGLVQALLPDLQGAGSRTLRGLLSLAPLRWVGQRSYGIYLWHWPLWVLAHYLLGPNMAPWLGFALILLTFVVAGLSYMYVEEPVRRLGFRAAAGAAFRALLGPAPLAARVWTGLSLLMLGLTSWAISAAPAMTQAQALVLAGADYAQKQKESQVPPSPSSSGQASASAQPSAAASPSAQASASAAAGKVDAHQVSIIGDSVVLAASPALGEVLPGAQVDAEVSRNSGHALPLVESQAKDGSLRKVLVLSVTANSTITTEQLDQVLEIIGPDRKLVLVTGVGPANLTWIAASNQVIKDFAAGHQGQVFVADWQAATAGHPEYLSPDGVHPVEAGSQAYAQVLKEALARTQGE